MDIIQQFDISILTYIQNNLTNEILNRFMVFISNLGNTGFIWIIISLVFLFNKNYYKQALTIIFALVLSLLICEIGVKNIFQRIRPFNLNTDIILLIPKPTGFSFPSNHTASSFAAATTIWFINKRFGFISFVLAFMIGFSRLYLYVHYPTDVITGALAGVSIGLLSILIFKKLKLI